ncbi:hypothetical protein AGMMS49992_18190 [Clostridia bacterium]|nr:hypothetical protein AGMMS49992_18190 [Clostridia bacterium]
MPLTTIFNVWYISRGSIEGENLSGLELRYIPLYQYISKARVSTNFDKAHLNRMCLFPSGHSTSIVKVIFSPDDDNWIASLSEEGVVRVWNINYSISAYLTKSKRIYDIAFIPHTSKIFILADNSFLFDYTGERIYKSTRKNSRLFFGVTSSCFSNNGRFLAIAYYRHVSIYEIDSYHTINHFRGHTSYINSIDISTDNKKLLTASSDKTAIIWDIASGNKIATLNIHKSAICCARFAPDGEKIATISTDCEIGIWNAITGEALSPLSKLIREPNSTEELNVFCDKKAEIIFSPDSRSFMVLFAGDRYSYQYKILENSISSYFDEHESSITTVAYSDNGKEILTSSKDKTARIWDAETGKMLTVFKGHKGEINSACISKSGDYVLTGSTDASIKVWNAKTGKVERTIYGKKKTPLRSAMSYDGTKFASASHDAIRVWDISTGFLLSQFTLSDDFANVLMFSRDAKKMLTASYDRSVRIWDIENECELYYIKKNANSVMGASFNNDTERIITISENIAQIWDSHSGKLVTCLIGHDDRILFAKFSVDDSRIVTISADYTAMIWNSSNYNCLSLIKLNQNSSINAIVTAFDMSIDNNMLVVGFYNNIVKVFNTNSCELIHEFIGNRGFLDTPKIDKVSFSKDGKLIAIISFAPNCLLHNVLVFDTDIGDVKYKLCGHKEQINGIDFSRNNKYMLTCANDCTARLWDTINGKQIVVYEHDYYVINAIFTPDSKKIIISLSNGLHIIWSVAECNQKPQKIMTFDNNYITNFEGCNFECAVFDDDVSDRDIAQTKKYKYALHSKKQSLRFNSDDSDALNAKNDLVVVKEITYRLREDIIKGLATEGILLEYAFSLKELTKSKSIAIIENSIEMFEEIISMYSDCNRLIDLYAVALCNFVIALVNDKKTVKDILYKLEHNYMLHQKNEESLYQYAKALACSVVTENANDAMIIVNRLKDLVNQKTHDTKIIEEYCKALSSFSILFSQCSSDILISLGVIDDFRKQNLGNKSISISYMYTISKYVEEKDNLDGLEDIINKSRFICATFFDDAIIVSIYISTLVNYARLLPRGEAKKIVAVIEEYYYANIDSKSLEESYSIALRNIMSEMDYSTGKKYIEEIYFLVKHEESPCQVKIQYLNAIFNTLSNEKNDENISILVSALDKFLHNQLHANVLEALVSRIENVSYWINDDQTLRKALRIMSTIKKTNIRQILFAYCRFLRNASIHYANFSMNAIEELRNLIELNSDIEILAIYTETLSLSMWEREQMNDRFEEIKRIAANNVNCKNIQIIYADSIVRFISFVNEYYNDLDDLVDELYKLSKIYSEDIFTVKYAQGIYERLKQSVEYKDDAIAELLRLNKKYNNTELTKILADAYCYLTYSDDQTVRDNAVLSLKELSEMLPINSDVLYTYSHALKYCIQRDSVDLTVAHEYLCRIKALAFNYTDNSLVNWTYLESIIDYATRIHTDEAFITAVRQLQDIVTIQTEKRDIIEKCINNCSRIIEATHSISIGYTLHKYIQSILVGQLNSIDIAYEYVIFLTRLFDLVENRHTDELMEEIEQISGLYPETYDCNDTKLQRTLFQMVKDDKVSELLYTINIPDSLITDKCSSYYSIKKCIWLNNYAE